MQKAYSANEYHKCNLCSNVYIFNNLCVRLWNVIKFLCVCEFVAPFNVYYSTWLQGVTPVWF